MTRILTIASVVWIETIRKKDAYVLLTLLAVLLFALLSVDVFGLGGVAGYVKQIGLLFAWAFAWILAVTVSARELPQEEKQGTIYPLLAKPLTRFELVVGKWLGAWTVVSLCTCCFYAVIVLVAYMRESPFRWDSLLQGYLLHCAALAIICAIAMALSTRMNFDAASTFAFAVTGAAFLILPRIPNLMTLEAGLRGKALYVLYYALPHFELFDLRQRLVFDDGPAPWTVILQVLVYGAIMAAAFLLLAWIGYRNKRFARGRVL